MKVTVELPEDIRKALEDSGADIQRQTLEALAVDGYRTGALDENQVRRLLGLDSRFDVHALLKAHRVPLRYTISDLRDDLAAHSELGISHER
jgi:hypothetical protein